MATTIYFSEVLRRAEEVDPQAKKEMEIEFGTSTFQPGKAQMFISIDGHPISLSEADAQKFCEAADRLASYLRLDV